MIYANLTVNNGCFTSSVKIVAETFEAYVDHKEYLEKTLNVLITEEFVDTDVGTIVVLPEDFKY